MRGRKPDKPGTFKIRPSKDGRGFVVSGVTLSGDRVRLPAGSREDGERIGNGIFSGGASSVFTETPPIPALPASAEPPISVSGWSLPKIDDATAAAFGNVTSSSPVQDEEKRRKDAAAREKEIANKARVETLCEFFGVAITSGDVWVSRKLTEALGKEPIKPSPQAMKRVADAWENALSTSFGDKKLSPWTLAIMLSLALPASMMLQSPSKKKEIAEEKPKSVNTPDGQPEKLKVV